MKWKLFFYAYKSLAQEILIFPHDDTKKKGIEYKSILNNFEAF